MSHEPKRPRAESITMKSRKDSLESFASTEPLPNNKNKRHVFRIARERERIVLDVVIFHDGWCDCDAARVDLPPMTKNVNH